MTPEEKLEKVASYLNSEISYYKAEIEKKDLSQNYKAICFGKITLAENVLEIIKEST